jgi:hypothetical protein
MKKPLNKYPKGWNKKKIDALVKHYDQQTEDEEVAEDEAAFNDPNQTIVLIPMALLPKVNKLLSAYRPRKNKSGGTGGASQAARRRNGRRAHAA